MTENTRLQVMSALLKSLYKQNFISEGVYHHCLGNLFKALDYAPRSEYDVAKREAQPDGCV